jgi:MFS family permease
MTTEADRTSRYSKWLVCIAALGGLLYGIDVGIIAAALLYLGKTISLNVTQTSIIVAAVLGGGMCSSLVAGALADWLGRKKMMVLSGFLFVASVTLIVLSHGFTLLLCGRFLQGISGGIIAVVVPLYLAESLSSEHRGRGTALFQFMLTFGIVLAALTGFIYTRQAEIAIAAAHGNAALILAAENHAWRGMFLSVVYPGILFFLGSLTLSETPRWLFRRGRAEAALESLRRVVREPEAQRELHEMAAIAAESQFQSASSSTDSLLQRRYALPFALACIILICNQTTGINSILGFLVIILRQAGMTASHATQGDVAVKLLNCAMTLIAVALVDRKGRKFLLQVGSGGMVVALLAAAFVFHTFESKRVDVTSTIATAVRGNALHIKDPSILFGSRNSSQPVALTVTYSLGHGTQAVTLLSNDPAPSLDVTSTPNATLVIEKAFYGPVPTETIGWVITAFIALFIASFSIGPGVVVWLALSELMPTRIRSTGMGVALLLNQGVSTLLAGIFLPAVGSYGYYAMFFFWAICTVAYFLVATFFLPETKGKSLEQIEEHFRASTVSLS